MNLFFYYSRRGTIHRSCTQELARTLNSFKLPTEFLGSEIIRKISGTSHLRTLTMSHLVLILHLAFLKCHHDFQIMTGTDFVNMTFRHMSWRNMPKHQMCKMCKFAQFGKIDENGQNAKKHHFGGGQKSTYFGVQKVQFRMQPPVEIPPNYVLFSIPPPPQIWPIWGILPLWHFAKNPKMLTRREFGNSRDV